MITWIDKIFWPRVDKKGPEDCWNWLGPITGAGYGHFWMGGRTTGKDISVHRLSWKLYNKQGVPEGLWILHKCDNRKCCNPNHLYAGTPSMNQSDRMERNPIRGGRESSMSLGNIERIRQLNKEGMSTRDIAHLLKKSQAYICMLINGKRGANANPSIA